MRAALCLLSGSPPARRVILQREDREAEAKGEDEEIDLFRVVRVFRG